MIARRHGRQHRRSSAGRSFSTALPDATPPLARAEMHVFLEEWLKAIPDFRLDPENPPISHSGLVNGMTTLPLVWDS